MYCQPCHTLSRSHLLADLNALATCPVLVLSCIEADYAIVNMNKFLMFPYNLWMSCLRKDTSCTSCTSLYPVDEQQFQTLSCIDYTIFSVVYR